MIISTPGTYTLTGDLRESITITANNVTLDLNGHTLRGSGFGTGISSTHSNVTVRNGEVTGFEKGISLDSAGAVHSNKVLNIDVHNCSLMGIAVGNNAGTVSDCNVWDIGGQTTFGFIPSFGVAMWGRNSKIINTNVWDIRGRSEAVAFGFNSKDNTGSILQNSTADGTGATGWSFGLWNSGGSITVVDNKLTGWDYGIGTVGPAAVRGTTIEKVAFVSSSGMTDRGGNTFTPLPDNNASSIVGTPGMNTLAGGPGANLLLGMGGLDHLAGRGGPDIFAMVRGQAIVNVIDFRLGDRIGVSASFGTTQLQLGDAATGSIPTFLYNSVSHVLHFDPDGAGAQPLEGLAYIPSTELEQSNLVTLPLPHAKLSVLSLVKEWSARASGDFNGDGTTDVIWQNTRGALSEWFIRDGERIGTMTLPTAPGWKIIADGDFNGDLTSDLLWQNGRGDVVHWLIDGGRRSASGVLPTIKAELLTTGDFNNDGTTDVLWQNAAGAVSAWEMEGGKRIATLQLPSLTAWELAASGDFNGDGTTDLIWQNSLGGLGEWVMNDFKRAATLALPAMKGWKAFATGDFNGDGTDDLVWKDSASDILVAWMMHKGRPAEKAYYGEAPGAELLAVGDIAGDGGDELLWRHQTTSKIEAWLV